MVAGLVASQTMQNGVFDRARAQSVQAAALKGPSGLALPRFVSLKFDRVNVRKGPSVNHSVAWIFARKGLPVEIIAEFENWRRVRDSDGEEGWVFHSLLSGRRTALVAPWKKGGRVSLYVQAGGKARALAVIEAGALGTVQFCSGAWCSFAVRGFQGWIKQDLLWGVYPGEKLK
jgi:SH3-like domain-containing protein